MEVKIQKAETDHLPELFAFARANFIATYAHMNTEENMEYYLKSKFTEESFTSEFSEAESDFFIAINESEIIGYFKANFGDAQTESDQPNSCEIERIYVHPRHKGQGIGRMLFETAVEYARSQGADYLWLGVWEENTKAITFYKRLGMKQFGTHIFQLGDDAQTDLLLRFDFNQ